MNSMEILYVAEYESDEDQENLLPARQKKNIDWEKSQTFNNNCEALEAVGNEKTWSKISKFTDCNGHHIVKYRCNKVKLRGEQCSAALRLVYHAQTTEVSLYRSNLEHDHDTIISKSKSRLTVEQKEKIANLFEEDDRIKPKSVIKKFANSNILLPTKLQVSNYLAILRKNKFGPCSLSLGELEIMLINKSVINDNESTPFVLNYNVDYDQETFKFCVTSKLLLKKHINVKHIHVDATYKLVWQGFPVLLVGTTDAAKQFHIICISVSTGETCSDFKWIFKSLQEKYLSFYGTEFSPNILISDAAASISKAFQNVFKDDELTCVTCWFHVLKNIEKNLRILVKDKKHKLMILEDIHSLQLSKSKDIFEKASYLFIEKWTEDAGDFCLYFKDQWLLKNSNWFEGVLHKIPKTNNALEATNKIIKVEQTLRERLPLNQFIDILFEYIDQWGKSYECKLKEIKTLPDISLSMWTQAYQWAREGKQIQQSNNDNETVFIIPGKSYKHIVNFMVNEFYSFDEYKTNCFSHYKVVLYKDKNILDGYCDCPCFFKNYVCKHIVGLGIRLKLLFPPVEAKNIPVGVKRKRGRPTKAKGALIIQ